MLCDDVHIQLPCNSLQIAARNNEVAKRYKAYMKDLYDSLRIRTCHLLHHASVCDCDPLCCLPSAVGSAITFETYSAWITKHPEVLNCLDTIQQVARIELGIRPPTLREEGSLVQFVFKVRLSGCVWLSGCLVA